MPATKLRRSSTETKESNNHAENRLLAALSRKDFRLLLPDFETVALPLNEIFYRCGDVIRYVYFPVDSVVFLLSEVEEDPSTLEVGVVGNEGMAGIAVFLGVRKSRNQMIVQGAGTALRMKAADLRRHANDGGRLQFLLQLYTHALLSKFRNRLPATVIIWSKPGSRAGCWRCATASA